MDAFVAQLTRALPEGVRPLAPRGRVSVLAAADPLAVWRRFLGALSGGVAAALLDPSWPVAWQARLRRLARACPDSIPAPVLLATSGTSGGPKWCLHQMATLRAAAEAYAQRFGAQGYVHAVSLLPANHVGGLMPVFRAAACGGRVHFADYRDPSSLRAAPFRLRAAALSLVPTQLARLLQVPEAVAVLRRFGLILVGGAACPEQVLAAARAAELRLAPCYGATETAAMVTVLEPEAFLQGATGVGSALPHARVTVDADRRIRVSSPANLLQYHPALAGFCRQPFATGDLGWLDSHGRLHILGRADRVIITGGKKVHPEQVEAAALATGLAATAVCAGRPDPEWGQRVILQVEPPATGADAAWRERLLAQLKERLPAYAVPKEICRLTAGDRPRPKLG